jgi:quercetin dioxygenase-like cupin family protein
LAGPFNIAEKHKPKDGLTISSSSGIKSQTAVTYFSLGSNTDISAETYARPVIYIGAGGTGTFRTGSGAEEKSMELGPGEMLMVPSGKLCGKSTKTGFVYTEIMPGKETNMNNEVKPGEVFKLSELVPYDEGSIVNMDVSSNDAMKFVIMAFDEGTGLSPHRAPGDAIVFALEGKAVIEYEGQDYPIEEGQAFRFEKNGMHAVTADGRFKMALLLMLK